MGGKTVSYYLHVFIIIVLSAGFIAPLIVDSELYDSTRMGKIFFFSRWMIVFVIACLPIYFMNKAQQIDKLTIAVLAWGIWILVRGKNGGIWYDEKFFWFSGCFVFYFLATTLLKEITTRGWEQLIRIPLVVIVLVAAVEAALGILQLYGLAPIYHGQFKISGHFFNPAPYAGFLVASQPFALLLSSVRPDTIINKIMHWLGYMSVCLILVAIPSTRSRAAYLGLGAVLLVWLLFRYHPWIYIKRVLSTQLKRQLAFFIIPLISIILLTGLYLLKKDSASGRLLIWKVAVHTIAERPLSGHGFNTTQATFAPVQADYFAAGNGTENESILAGSVRWAFNEFLQTASETGIVGLVLFLLVTAYALFFKIRISPQSRKHRLMIGAARSSMSGVLVFSCFSYPFYSMPITLLFFFSLAGLTTLHFTGANELKTVLNIFQRLPIFVGILLLTMFYIVETPKLKQAYGQWNKAEQSYKIGAYRKANEGFAKAYPTLVHNGLFLQQYGKSLEMEERYPQAIALLKQATKYYNDEFTAITLGNCYRSIGDHDKAEMQYRLAANVVPNKFYPLYLLVKLYDETGQTEKARAMARELLNKEVKVPSKAIEEIKAEMERLIHKNASLQNWGELEGSQQEVCTPQTVFCLHPSYLRKEVAV